MSSLEIELFDKDLVGRDDKLGKATISLSAAIASPRVTLELNDVALSTQGTVTLRATYLPKPPRIAGGDSTPIGEDDPNAIDETWTESRGMLHGMLRVRLLSATNLIAADKGGTSDPYVLLTTNGGVTQKSVTVKKTLDPIWEVRPLAHPLGPLLHPMGPHLRTPCYPFASDAPTWQSATFEWRGARSAMRTLELTLFDWDRVGSDDRLGSAAVDLSASGVLEEGVGEMEARRRRLRAMQSMTAWGQHSMVY